MERSEIESLFNLAHALTPQKFGVLTAALARVYEELKTFEQFGYKFELAQAQAPLGAGEAADWPRWVYHIEQALAHICESAEAFAKLEGFTFRPEPAAQAAPQPEALPALPADAPTVSVASPGEALARALSS